MARSWRPTFSYVAFGYGVIGTLSELLVNEPMMELKQSLGIAPRGWPNCRFWCRSRW